MTVTMTATLDALTLVDDPTGTDPQMKLMSIDGWYSAPPVETTIDSIPLADGGFDSPSYRRPRKISLNGMVTASSAALAKAAAWRTIAGLAPTGNAMLLTVTDELGPLTTQVRLDTAPQVVPYTGRTAFFQIPLVAPDPRKYGPLHSSTIGIGSVAATDGMAFPLFAPGYLDFGAFTATNALSVSNTGTAPTWPTFLVRGSFDSAGFTITSNGGDVITFGRSVSPGSTLTISPYAGGRATVDGSDQSVFLNATWSPIPPGGTRTYSIFAGGSTDVNAAMTVNYREAWW